MSPDSDDRTLSFSMLESTEIEKFLAASGAVGEYVGLGEFSVNLKQAMQSLEMFTLAEPGFYVRYLVASAVARGADRIEVTTGLQKLTITDNGAPFDFESLTGALPSLMNSPSSRNAGRRYLAVGLCGARAAGFYRATVTCPAAQLVLMNSRVEVTPRGEGASTVVEITEKKSLTKFAAQLVRKTLWDHVETALHTFRYLEKELILNGRILREIHPAGEGLRLQLIQGSGKDADPTKVYTELPISGWISLQTELGGPLSLITHGICFESRTHPVCALIYCDQLLLSASFQGLVQNELFDKVIEEVRHQRLLGALQMVADPATAGLAAESLGAIIREYSGDRAGRAIESASFLGLGFRELRHQFVQLGYLPLSPEMEVLEPALRELFPSTLRLSEVELAESLELLSDPACAVYQPPERPYALRFCTESVHHPCRCVPLSETPKDLEDYGPFGFQLVWLRLQNHSSDYLYRYEEFRDFGLSVSRAVESKYFYLSRVRDFFLNLMEWLLDVGGNMARRESLRFFLVFEREDGHLLTYGELSPTVAVPYTLDSEPRSSVPSALRLRVRELQMLKDLGEVMVQPL